MNYFRFFLFIYFIGMLAPSLATAQITLNINSQMNFGSLMFDATHSGTVQMGTNGSASVAGTGLAHLGGSIAGNIGIEGSGEVVEVKCSTSGQLSLQNSKIDISATEVSLDAGVNAGNAIACEGTKRSNPAVLVIDLSANSTPEILVGATLSISSNSLDSGLYDTSGGGGAKPIVLTVIVQ